MAWSDFDFEPTDGLSNTTTFVSKPVSGAAARAQFMTVLNQIKAFLNGTAKTEITANTTAITALQDPNIKFLSVRGVRNNG